MQNNPSGIVFSDEAIILASVFIGLALGIAVGFLLINVSIKFPQKSNSHDSGALKPTAGGIANIILDAACVIMSAILIWIILTKVCFKNYVPAYIISFAGVAAEGFMLWRTFRNRACYMARLIYVSVSITFMLIIGVKGAIDWCLTDVITVSRPTWKFSTKTTHMAGSSEHPGINSVYVNTLTTKDTLYRVVVNYAIPWEGDTRNLFEVTDTILPRESKRVNGPVFAAMKKITQWKRPQNTRMGHRHRREAILASGAQLRFFIDREVPLRIIENDNIKECTLLPPLRIK